MNLFRSGKVKSSVSQVALKKAKKCPCRGRSASYPHPYPSSRSPSALSPGICGTTPARGGVEGGSLDITSELTDSTCECGLGLT